MAKSSDSLRKCPDPVNAQASLGASSRFIMDICYRGHRGPGGTTRERKARNSQASPRSRLTVLMLSRFIFR